MRPVFSALLSVSILCGGLTAHSEAEEPAKPSIWSLGVTAGTLGAGVEASVLLYDKVVLRVDGTYVKLDSSWVLSASSLANDYNIGVTGIFAGGIVDYHPFSSGWRVSAGARYVDIELQGVAKNGMSFNGVRTAPATLGT